jgi:hypothetical protein
MAFYVNNVCINEGGDTFCHIRKIIETDGLGWSQAADMFFPGNRGGRPKGPVKSVFQVLLT